MNIKILLASAALMLSAQAEAARTFTFDLANAAGQTSRVALVGDEFGPNLFRTVGFQFETFIVNTPTSLAIGTSNSNPFSSALIRFAGNVCTADGGKIGQAVIDSACSTFEYELRSPSAGQQFTGKVTSLLIEAGNTLGTGDTFRVSAVPEPATWAMMLLGFGMVAGMARYRRRATVVAFN